MPSNKKKELKGVSSKQAGENSKMDVPSSTNQSNTKLKPSGISKAKQPEFKSTVKTEKNAAEISKSKSKIPSQSQSKHVHLKLNKDNDVSKTKLNPSQILNKSKGVSKSQIDNKKNDENGVLKPKTTSKIQQPQNKKTKDNNGMSKLNIQSKAQTNNNEDFSKSKFSSMEGMLLPEPSEARSQAKNVNPQDGVALRLCVHQKTKMDLVKDSIPKPHGYLPPRYLPTWETMLLEQRLPMLPAPPGSLYFTRGKLSETLHRKNVIYSTNDPLNQERTTSDKYESLHDPETRLDHNFHAQEYLTRTGAVNENGEVICTLKEFNRYRKYLATLYNDEVREKIHQMDDLHVMEREQDRELLRQELLKKGEGKQAIRNERVANAKEFLRRKGEEKWKRYVEQEKEHEKKLLYLAQEKERYRAYLTQVNGNQKRMQLQKLKDKDNIELLRKRSVLHRMTLKDMQSAANKHHMDNNRKIIHEQKQAKWFDSKIVSAAERLEHEKEVQADYSETMNRRAIKRQKHIEKFRAGLPMRIEQRKAAKLKLDLNVRKFAMRWLNRVRDRLRKSTDEQHESIWYSSQKNSLRDGVDYLYQQSGHEKLDDVVMNILKFKEALKKQMLMEEEDEEEEDEEDFEDEGNNEE